MEKVSKRLMNWASILDEGARKQAVVTSGMPFIHPHVALMPDAHLGKGATVGSVIPTLRSDHACCGGCGHRVRDDGAATGVAAEELRSGPGLAHAAIGAAVPLSAGRYNSVMYSDETLERVAALEALPGFEQAEAIAPNWRQQLGSLGSGNHFIEVSLDEHDDVWLFLHSGSRGVGNKLAMKHIKVAQQQCERRWISLPDRDLAYLVEGEPEFWSYLEALRWAQRFAYLNREEMMHRVVDAFVAWADLPGSIRPRPSTAITTTRPAKALPQEVWLSRKGAIERGRRCAWSDPGSMGAASYVVGRHGQPPRLELLAARGRPQPLTLRSQAPVHP